MIVCVIDDLMFSIKISTAAKQLGAAVFFERSREHVLTTIREKRPRLVIFDLNSSRLAPMDMIAAIKADPELDEVKTLGYVSHVDSDAIAAARRAGVDQVMARSAFTDQLGRILMSAR
jgi:DNA-binding NarL/FixJ family response regulator